MAKIIKNHNKKVTFKVAPRHPNEAAVKRTHAHSTGTAKQPALFTKPKSRQPQILKKTYIGLTEETLETKKLHTQIIIQQPKIHQQHYIIKAYKEIKGQKDNNQAPEITWSIKTSAPAYTSITKRCMLCMQEEMAIITFPDEDNLLNRRSELISKCRHEN